jgi:hypothetical protein
MTGAMLWCYGDYDQKLWNDPPLEEAAHERYFGLWRSDYSAKPAVRVIENVAGSSATDRRDDFEWIDVKRDEFYQSPPATLRHLYRLFLDRSR